MQTPLPSPNKLCHTIPKSFPILPSTIYHMEKAMAPHSSILAWKIPWTEEPGRLQSMGLLRVGTTERLHFDFSLSCIGEGNGNPLPCSCLENPRDEGTWWAAVYGVAQSWTRLKRLSSNLGLPSLNTFYGNIRVIQLKACTYAYLTSLSLHFFVKRASS